MKYNYFFKNYNKSKKADSSIETGYRKIIITAILTAVITSVTQYFLQKSQLSSEQDYWRKRYKIENLERVNNARIKLIEEINEGILQLEVQAKEIKILSVSTKYSNSLDDIKKLTELSIQYHKDLYKNASKAQLASMYFGKKVDSLIPKLGDALTENFQNNLIRSDIRVNLPEFKLDFETTKNLDLNKKLLLEAMLKEIEESYK